MNFLFEITPDYLFGYNDTEVFRAKVSYDKPFNAGITNVHIDMPFRCLMYIVDGVKLAADIWKALLKHSEVTIEENKEFMKLVEKQEKFFQ